MRQPHDVHIGCGEEVLIAFFHELFDLTDHLHQGMTDFRLGLAAAKGEGRLDRRAWVQKLRLAAFLRIASHSTTSYPAFAIQPAASRMRRSATPSLLISGQSWTPSAVTR